MDKFPTIVLVGPTGIGKTELALKLAERFAAEIIGADSMQVYRYMDIGTAKPTMEERARIPHHLIDFVDPADHYTVARFVTDARAAGTDIEKRGKLPFLVGGTGMYLRGLLQGLFEHGEQKEGESPAVREELKMRLAQEGREQLHEELKRCDPESAMRIHLNDTHRLLRALEIFKATGIPWSQHLMQQKQMSPPASRVLKLGLTCPREELYDRINTRVKRMLGQGLLAEVEKLLAMGYHGGLKSMQSIGYRHMVNYLSGEWSWDEAVELLARDTRRYAKRQFTWFQRDPEIRWFELSQAKELIECFRVFVEEAKAG